MKKIALIIVPSLFLAVTSLVMIASISPNRLILQIIFSIFAGVVGLTVYRIGARDLVLFAKVIYGVVFGMLLLTIIFGSVTRGSTRWLEVGGMKLQASEIAKPALLLLMVSLVKKEPWSNLKPKQQLKKLGKILIWVMPMIAIVAKQPDLGTALSLIAIVVTVLYVSKLPIWIMSAAVLLLVIMVPLSTLVLKDYQKARIETFLDPYADPRGAGYQVIQSTITVGSGMWLGRGLGRGTQSQLQFLPERQTDFIFASLVEELGLLGGGVVIGFYALIITGLLMVAEQTKKKESWLLIIGTTGWLFSQTAINIAMNLGLAPVTGIPLPLLSAGGSSLLASAIFLGIALSA